MAVLVTGGTGYIGSHTVVELLNEGKDVVIVDNLFNSKVMVLDRIAEIVDGDLEDGRLSFYEADILDKEALDLIFGENDIDSVIHFAGLKAVGESVEKPLAYYENNVSGTVVLLEAMMEAGVKKIVFSSSATVYGLNNVSPLTEDLPLSTNSPYGSTKLMIEQILTDVYQAKQDWSVILLRYFNPIGAHASGRIGEDPKGIPNNLMPYITQVAVGKREKLSIFGSDYETVDGTGVRDYIHVVDLAQGHVKAIDYIEDKACLEAINLGTGNGVSVLQMVGSFEKANKVKVNYEIVGRRAGDVDTCFADASKAKKLLGWQAKYDIEDMCRDSWNWQSNNPNGYEE